MLFRSCNSRWQWHHIDHLGGLVYLHPGLVRGEIWQLVVLQPVIHLIALTYKCGALSCPARMPRDATGDTVRPCSVAARTCPMLLRACSTRVPLCHTVPCHVPPTLEFETLQGFPFALLQINFLLLYKDSISKHFVRIRRGREREYGMPASLRR